MVYGVRHKAQLEEIDDRGFPRHGRKLAQRKRQASRRQAPEEEPGPAPHPRLVELLHHRFLERVGALSGGLALDFHELLLSIPCHGMPRRGGSQRGITAARSSPAPRSASSAPRRSSGAPASVRALRDRDRTPRRRETASGPRPP